MLNLLPAIAVLVIGSYDPKGPQPTAPVPPPGQVAPVSKSGNLDRQTVRYYIRLQQPAVRHCYVMELGKQPNLKTRVTLNLSIDATGRVTRCVAGSTPLDRCVARAVCTIRFPYVYDTLRNGQTQVSMGSTQVRYSFRFQPRKRKKRGQPSETTVASRPPPSTPAPTTKEPPPTAATTQPAPIPSTQPSTQPAPATGYKPGHKPLPRIKTPKGKDPLEGLDLLNPL